MTKAMYQSVVALDLNVHSVLTKKLNVTATHDPISFDISWLKSIKLNNAPKQSHWLAVFNIPTATLRLNSFNIIKISEFLEVESLALERGLIDMRCWRVRQNRNTQSFASVCKASCCFLMTPFHPANQPTTASSPGACRDRQHGYKQIWYHR